MFNRYLIPICLTFTSVLIAAPQVDAARETRAILARDVAAIAKKTVVRIEASDGGFGSGVIIGRTEKGNKNVYTILTAAHVIRGNNLNYRIITPLSIGGSGERKRSKISINLKQGIKIFPNVDLAEISFESSDTFAIGTLGNSQYADEGSPVYVAGFPQPGKAINRIAFQFTGGMISSRLEESDRDPKKQNNGYDLIYTSITRAGMSGGPVLDIAGRIIAIHGQGDRNSPTGQEEGNNALPGDEKTGFNLGIPIQTFLKLQPQASTTIGARLDLSPVNPQVSDNSATIGTRHEKFTKKFRTRSDAPPLFDVTKVNEKTYE